MSCAASGQRIPASTRTTPVVLLLAMSLYHTPLTFESEITSSPVHGTKLRPLIVSLAFLSGALETPVAEKTKRVEPPCLLVPVFAKYTTTQTTAANTARAAYRPAATMSTGENMNTNTSPTMQMLMMAFFAGFPPPSPLGTPCTTRYRDS